MAEFSKGLYIIILCKFNTENLGKMLYDYVRSSDLETYTYQWNHQLIMEKLVKTRSWYKEV